MEELLAPPGWYPINALLALFAVHNSWAEASSVDGLPSGIVPYSVFTEFGAKLVLGYGFCVRRWTDNSSSDSAASSKG